MKSEKSSDAILTFFCRQKNNVIAQKMCVGLCAKMFNFLSLLFTVQFYLALLQSWCGLDRLKNNFFVVSKFLQFAFPFSSLS
jgi:hypothetical protein